MAETGKRNVRVDDGPWYAALAQARKDGTDLSKLINYWIGCYLDPAQRPYMLPEDNPRARRLPHHVQHD